MLGICRKDQSTYFGRPVSLSYHWPALSRTAIRVPVNENEDNAGEGSVAAGAAAEARTIIRPCHARFQQPRWLPRDDADALVCTVHFQLLLPTFRCLIRRIRDLAPGYRGENAVEWEPRQIFGATSSSSQWTAIVDGTRRPHLADIVRISDDDTVRAWLAASPKGEILRLCVIYHQEDEDNHQTPLPPFTEYLPGALYDDYGRSDEGEE